VYCPAEVSSVDKDTYLVTHLGEGHTAWAELPGSQPVSGVAREERRAHREKRLLGCNLSTFRFRWLLAARPQEWISEVPHLHGVAILVVQEVVRIKCQQSTVPATEPTSTWRRVLVVLFQDELDFLSPMSAT
jgi:hypothetical protein